MYTYTHEYVHVKYMYTCVHQYMCRCLFGIVADVCYNLDFHFSLCIIACVTTDWTELRRQKTSGGISVSSLVMYVLYTYGLRFEGEDVGTQSILPVILSSLSSPSLFLSPAMLAVTIFIYLCALIGIILMYVFLTRVS